MSSARVRPFAAAALALCACAASEAPVPDAGPALPPLADFQEAARSRRAILELPRFEQTPAEVAATVAAVLARADERLARLAAQDPQRLSFESTIAALDDLSYPVATVLNRVALMKESRQEAALREACADAELQLGDWYITLGQREDVYQVCQDFAAAYEAGRGPRLAGEELELYRETMREFRRLGLALAPEQRARLAALRQELNQLASDFDACITETQVVLRYPAERLPGVPESFLRASLTPEGDHAVRVTVTPDYLTVMENCADAETRRELDHARSGLAMEQNGPTLDRLVEVRRQIAEALGYATWADYQIEPRMARTAARALAFVEDLAAGLQPKFDAEVEDLRRLKAEETGDPQAQLRWWDFRYYQTQLTKRRYQVDAEALRVYFQLDRVLDGMFDIFQRIFGLRFVEVDPGWKWVDD